MDYQVLFNILMGIISFVIGLVVIMLAWWMKTIWSLIQTQQALIVDLQVKLAQNYIPRQELQNTLRQIFDKLDEIKNEVYVTVKDALKNQKWTGGPT